MFTYKTFILQSLLIHGVRPTTQTPPEIARGFLRDLYKYEIRRLRERYMRKEFPKKEYAEKVDALRRKYPALSLPASQWIEPSSRSK
jgi:hypothetical protein